MAYPFLSDEWIAEARKIRSEYEDRTPAMPLVVRMNQVITDVPFGTGSLQAHLDTSGGMLDLDLGHLERPDLTITVEYTTVRAILVDGDAQAAMQAFLSGRIKVDGDITKLLALQSSGLVGGADPVAFEVYERIKAITD